MPPPASSGGYGTSPRVIPRYSRPELAALWDDKYRFELWLEIERAAHPPRRDRVSDPCRGARGRAGALVAPRDDVVGCPRHVARDPDRTRARPDRVGRARARRSARGARARARGHADHRALARDP